MATTLVKKTAPKKAAKHAAKHAAKKTVPKKAAKKSAGRPDEMRRCYEHFGRVSSLMEVMSESERDLLLRLGSLAQQLIRQDELKSAADALRAAEHIAFGRLAARPGSEGDISPALQGVLQAACAHLLERAESHAAALDGPVLPIYKAVRREAAAAQKASVLRAGMELARAAEALTHVTAPLTARLRAADWKRLEAPE